MQNPRNHDARSILPGENDVLAVLHAVQTVQNLLTGAAKRRIIRQHLATNFEVVKIMYRLFFAPRAQCISRYSEQVGLGAT